MVTVWTEESSLPDFYTSRWKDSDENSRLVVFYYRPAKGKRKDNFILATHRFQKFFDGTASLADAEDTLIANGYSYVGAE